MQSPEPNLDPRHHAEEAARHLAIVEKLRDDLDELVAEEGERDAMRGVGKRIDSHRSSANTHALAALALTLTAPSTHVGPAPVDNPVDDLVDRSADLGDALVNRPSTPVVNTGRAGETPLRA